MVASSLLLLMMGLGSTMLAGGRSVPAPHNQTPRAQDERALRQIESRMRAYDFAGAERLFAKLVKGYPDDPAAYFQMGKLCFEQEEWERAGKYLQQSLQLDPRNDQAHLLLGLVWRQLQRPEDAERELLEAARLRPQSDVNVFFAGHQLLLDGKDQAALPYLYRALELNPHRSDAFRALGMAQARLGNYALAESYYRKALEATGGAESTDAASSTDLAFLLLLGHEPEKVREALKYAQRAVELQPSSPLAHYLVGKAQLKLGNLRAAVSELERAVELKPEDAKPHFLLARAYDQLGDKKRAEKERQTLAKLKQGTRGPGVATGTPALGREE